MSLDHTDKPRLDFDSPEAKLIFSSLDSSSLPPLLLPSNATSPNTSACSSSTHSTSSSPRVLHSDSDFPDVFGKSLFLGAPPLMLPPAAYSSNCHASRPASTLPSQHDESQVSSRKKLRAVEDEQKQLKRTKKSFNLKTLM